MPSACEAPACLLCGGATELLYPSNVPNGTALQSEEFACTSPHLSIHNDIFVCRACELGRSVPSDASVDIEGLYRDVKDTEYLASEEERRDEFRTALGAIESRGFAEERGSLLEIGSSAGLFLDEANKRGWDVLGIEPSEWAARKARAYGVEVFNGTLDGFEAGGRQFDVVASWDVWEHLEDPMHAFERCYSLLKPHGLLVATTVNMGGLGAKLLGSRWPWYMRMHLHYFTRGSLTEMVRRAGFDVLDVSTQPKTLKLDYLLERSSGMFGPLAKGAQKIARGLGVHERPVSVDLEDILQIEARAKS